MLYDTPVECNGAAFETKSELFYKLLTNSQNS
jgi:hypothetical protein